MKKDTKLCPRKTRRAKEAPRLRAMMTASAMPGELADRYANLCEKLAAAGEKCNPQGRTVHRWRKICFGSPGSRRPDFLGSRAGFVAHAYAGYER